MARGDLHRGRPVVQVISNGKGGQEPATAAENDPFASPVHGGPGNSHRNRAEQNLGNSFFL